MNQSASHIPFTLCIDARMIDSPGIGTYIRGILPFLDAAPFTLTLLTEKPFLQYRTIPFSAPIYSFAEQIGFRSKIPQTDLFWSPHYNVPLLPMRSKKRIVTIHDVCHLAYPPSFLKKSAAYFLLKNAKQRSDLILTVSEFSKREIIKYLGGTGENIHVVYPGISIPEAPCSQNTLVNDPFFLFVGTGKPHKNLATLLQAFFQLNQPEYHLALVGKSLISSLGDLQTFIHKSALKKNIHLFENLPSQDLFSLYANAEATIFPSFYEGFGFPPLEAMASGCPVIASEAASIPEVCGDGALYFSPYSADDLAKKMQMVVSNRKLREELISKGRARTAFFSWGKAARQCAELFVKIF